jgi:hypothetical protein
LARERRGIPPERPAARPEARLARPGPCLGAAGRHLGSVTKRSRSRRSGARCRRRRFLRSYKAFLAQPEGVSGSRNRVFASPLLVSEALQSGLGFAGRHLGAVTKRSRTRRDDARKWRSEGSRAARMVDGRWRMAVTRSHRSADLLRGRRDRWLESEAAEAITGA